MRGEVHLGRQVQPREAVHRPLSEVAAAGSGGGIQLPSWVGRLAVGSDEKQEGWDQVAGLDTFHSCPPAAQHSRHSKQSKAQRSAAQRTHQVTPSSELNASVIMCARRLRAPGTGHRPGERGPLQLAPPRNGRPRQSRPSNIFPSQPPQPCSLSTLAPSYRHAYIEACSQIVQRHTHRSEALHASFSFSYCA